MITSVVQHLSSIVIAMLSYFASVALITLLSPAIGLLAALEAQPIPMGTGDPQVSAILSDTENLLDSLLDEVEREIRIAKERQALQKPGLSLGALEIDSTGITNTESDIVDRLFALSNND